MPHPQTSSNKAYQSPFNQLDQEPTTLNSQPSLPSVPSLATQPDHHHHHYPTTNYHCVATLKGHASCISSIALAGKFLYTGSSDKEIRLWSRSTLTSESDDEYLTAYREFAGNGAVKSLVVFRDKLISAHQDHKIRVWKIDSPKSDHHKFTRLATLPTLSDRALKLLAPKNHIQIRRNKKCTWVHVDTVSALALSRDESLLYSVSWDQTLKIWQTTNFKCMESVSNAHDDAINAVALSMDGDVYTGSADKTIKLWRKNSGETKHSLVATLDKHNSGVNALALREDGMVLYSGACDRSILVWEKDHGGNMVAMEALRGHTKSILCLAVVKDLVCSGSTDRSVRIWREVDRTYSCLAVLEGHKGPVKCLTAVTEQYNPADATSSYLLYSGGLDSDIKVWKIPVPLL